MLPTQILCNFSGVYICKDTTQTMYYTNFDNIQNQSKLKLLTYYMFLITYNIITNNINIIISYTVYDMYTFIHVYMLKNSKIHIDLYIQIYYVMIICYYEIT